MKIKELEKLNKPYKIYAELVEPDVISQFVNTMEQDSIVKGALMPDAHLGYTLPIGGVVAADNMIYPSYIGFDIGCGCSTIKTTIKKDQVKDKTNKIFNEIYRAIPVGFSVNKYAQSSALNSTDLTDLGREAFDERKGFKALGSLGGGNHFVEIGSDGTNNIWIIIHSGSRGVGHGIATRYMRLASGDGKVREGHFGFKTDSQEGKAYINDMNWALEFALENRKELITRTLKVLMRNCEGGGVWDSFINRNHNHAELKDGLWVHRKGATHAEKDMMGVIPGNMKDGSFIVKGKGNPDSLYSSSHGAGRILSRKKAKLTLDMEDFKAVMKDIKAKVKMDTLDESPMAYKNIFDVMNQQNDLVDIECLVQPIINVKG